AGDLERQARDRQHDERPHEHPSLSPAEPMQLPHVAGQFLKKLHLYRNPWHGLLTMETFGGDTVVAWSPGHATLGDLRSANLARSGDLARGLQSAQASSPINI